MIHRPAPRPIPRPSSLPGLALAGLIAALPLPAGAANDAPVVLDKVVVEATPFKGDADDLVQPVIVLSGKELDRKRKSTLGEVLEGELGVSTTDFGAGVGRPVIRGQGGSRVLVLNNGVSAMDVSSVSDDHAVSVDPAHAEQVEVIKGPATLIYGNNASAGVVNVVDSRLPDAYQDGTQAEAEYAYGINGDESTGRIELGQGTNHNYFHADVARRTADQSKIPGYSNADRSAPGQDGRIPNSSLNTTSGALSAAHYGERGMFGASLSHFNSHYGLPAEEEAFLAIKQTRLDLKGAFKDPLSGFTALRAKFGGNVYTHTEFEAVGMPGTKFYNQEQELRVEADHAPIGRFKGVVGVQLNQRRFEARGEEALTPKTDTIQAGLFAVEQAPFTLGVPGQAEFGARLEAVQHDPASDKIDPRLGVASRSRDIMPVSVSAAAKFELSQDYHLRFNLSRSERAPTPEELYAYGPHGATGVYERGNQNLKREAASNFEISLDKHLGRFTWLTNVYYEEIKNYVFLSEAAPDGRNADGSDSGTAPSAGQQTALVDAEGRFVTADEGGFVLADYRQADARFYGAEAEARYKLLTGPVKLSSRVFGDLVRGSIKNGGDLPRITPPRYGLGLDAHRGPVSGSLSYTRVVAQKHFALDGETAGYNLLSADLGYQYRQATLFLRGRNLLDEDARRATSFLKNVNPLAGRSIYLGVSFKL